MVWLIVGSLLVIFTLGATGQDIMFPDDESYSDRVSGNNSTVLTERLPIYEPGRCPINMLLYPGDGNKSAWECDCKAGFLYFPLNNSCHAAYRQGPCPPQHYVVLSPGEVVPKCERNPCTEDNWVRYANSCYKLGTIGEPCFANERLGVNVTTFQVECMLVEIVVNHIIDVPANRCPAGSRRNTLGQCRKVI